MKLFCYTALKQNQIPASKQVNRIGKYLYKNLDGAYRCQNASNMCDVYVTLLYAIPADIVKKYKIDDSEVYEMTLNLNITTYQNKVRINIIEITPQERTIGYDLYLPEELENLPEAMKMIRRKIIQRVSKAYADYDFLV